MMYLEYLLILLWTPIRKLIGLPITMIVIPFRGYARNVVHNYVLQNRIYLQRLLERKPYLELDYFIILPYHGTKGGYIKYRKISWLEYKLVYYFIWQWLDDDSNQDTYDADNNQKIVDGKKLTWVCCGVKSDLQRDIDKAKVFGNAFDLGDMRAKYPLYGFWSSLFWSARNTAYNAKYMTMEKHISDKNIFMLEFGKWKFGWKQDEANKENFSFVAFGWD